MIVATYLLREVLRAFLGVLAVLIVIYVGHRFGRFLGQASVGSVPADVLIELTVLKVVENLPLLLPLTLYLASLLALGRLYRDGEIIAMLAGGIGASRITQALLGLSVVFAMAVAAVTLHFAPSVVTIQEEVMRRAYEQTPIAGLQPGRFRDMQQGEVVVYFEDLADDGRTFINAFGQVTRDGNQDVFVADRAYQMIDNNTQTPFLVLENGEQYSGLPGQLDYTLTRFQAYARQLPRLEASEGIRKLRAVPTRTLLQSDRLDYAAELQWRLAMPVSVIVLALLAVPLSSSSPREGRYARLFTAVAVFFAYQNGIGVMQNLVERGVVPPAVGAWPAHAVAVGLAYWLTWVRSPVRRRFPWKALWPGRRPADAKADV